MSWWRGSVPVRFAPDVEARSRPGVTVAGGPPVHIDTGQNYYMSRAELSYLSCAESPTSSSRCSCCEMHAGSHAVPQGLEWSWVHVWQQAHGLDVILLVGLGVGRLRHQGDIEEALAVRRRRRGGAWSSSCDHAATSSAVLCRSFGVVPQLQFFNRADGVRDGVLLVLSSVVHRDRPTVLSFLQGSGCCSTLTRLSMLETRLLYGRISHIFYVLALCAWNLDLISSSPLFWKPLAPVRCDSPRKLLDDFRLYSS